jgi:hypothetical protein
MYMWSEVQSVRNRVKGPMAGRKYILGSGNGVQSPETTRDRVRSSGEVRIPLHIGWLEHTPTILTFHIEPTLALDMGEIRSVHFWAT